MAKLFLASQLLAWSFFLPCCGVAAGLEIQSDALPEWNARFQRTNGWIGADGDLSVPLSKDLTLWLFGDTFVGDVADGRRVNAAMINNSVALQRGTNTPEFFYRTAPDRKPASFFKPNKKNRYFWPLHGTRVGGDLWVFLLCVTNVQSGTPFGFKLLDCWLARIANPDAPPLQWRITERQLPFTSPENGGWVSVGASVLNDNDFVYIFSNYSPPKSKGASVVMARVPSAQVGDFKQWRFWGRGGWQKDFRNVTPIFPDVGSEFSITRRPALNGFAAVYSVGIGGKIVLRTATALAGPWSEPVQIYRVPEMDWPVKPFSYAGKAHPELAAAPNELVVTYAASSSDFWTLFKDARLYWPRFVRIKVTVR